jgi:hypothetical protein
MDLNKFSCVGMIYTALPISASAANGFSREEGRYVYERNSWNSNRVFLRAATKICPFKKVFGVDLTIHLYAHRQMASKEVERKCP